MRLPNPELAVVDIVKLTDYCLNPKHEDGKHKARVFAAALSISQVTENGCRIAFSMSCAKKPLSSARAGLAGST